MTRTRASGLLIATIACAVLCGCTRRTEIDTAKLPQLRHPEFYSSGWIRGRVLDAETKEPVSGAAVVVVWRAIHLYSGEWALTYRYGDLVTDEEGRFTVPAWGPHTHHPDRYLDKRDPEIWVLKNGYLLGYFDNEAALDPRVFRTDASTQAIRISKPPPNQVLGVEPDIYARAAEASSVWDGTDLLLHRVRSSSETARTLSSADPLGPSDVGWVHVPRFWEEWLRCHDSLPPNHRASVQRPRGLVQYEQRQKTLEGR